MLVDRYALWSIGAAVFLAVIPASATAETVLEPSSAWNLDYGEDACRLSRVFGEGETQTVFHIEQSAVGPYFNLALFGKPARRRSSETMSVQFGDEREMNRGFLGGKQDEPTSAVIIMHGVHLSPVPEDAKQGEFPVVELENERVAKIDRVRFAKGLRTPLTLKTGPLDKPFDALKECTINLVEALGLREEDQAKISVGPTPKNLTEIARFIQERYPSKMVENKEEGVVTVRLTIDPEGKPSACQIAKSDRPAVFDDYVCFGLMRIGQFEPAKGEDGEPRYGFFTQSVRYILP